MNVVVRTNDWRGGASSGAWQGGLKVLRNGTFGLSFC